MKPLETIILRLIGVLLCASSIFLVGFVDCISDERIDFSVFYFIPISVASVFFGKPVAAIMSLTAAGAYYLANDTPAPQLRWFLYINFFLHLASFLIIGMAFSRLKEEYDQVQLLKRKLSRFHRKLGD